MKVGSLILIAIVGLASCKKKDSADDHSLPVVYTPNALEKWFETSVLNRESIIQFAKDSAGTDVTHLYDSTIFILRKKSYHDGPFIATKSGKSDTGEWIANADYSKLTLKLTGEPEYKIFNIDWKFKSKSTSKLDLIPWFTFDGDRNLIIIPK